MDWGLDEMRACTFQVAFARRGRVLFTATTHAGYIGFITAVAPGRYGISVNYRYGQELYGGLDVRLPAVVKRVKDGVHLGYNPITFAVRHAFEHMETYDEVVAYMKSVDTMAPCYFSVVGTQLGEGCIITRSQSHAELWPLWDLATDGPTCQTNDDIFTEDDGWRPNEDPSGSKWVREGGAKLGKHRCHRRNLAERAISDLAEGSINGNLTAGAAAEESNIDGKTEASASHCELDPTKLWMLMSVVPLRNPETIFTTSMCPKTGHYISAMGLATEDQELATVLFKGPQVEEEARSECLAEGCDFFGAKVNDGYCSSCYQKVVLGGRGRNFL